MVEQREPGGPPPFDSVFESEDAEQRIYGTILGLREPTSAGEIAETADCDPKTARKYLSWFAKLGVVTEHGRRPTTYQRNDAYFEWRKRQRLADCSMDELQNRLETLTARERTFRERYGADTPADVDALAHVDYDELEDVWLDLSEWQTVRDRIERLEAVRRRRTSDLQSSGSEAV